MRVRIFQHCKSTMQSGRGKSQEWNIEPELLSARIPDALMGWSSAEDTMGELRYRLNFASKEEAVVFAEKQGWEYMVQETKARKVTPRNYLDNFRWVRPQDESRGA